MSSTKCCATSTVAMLHRQNCGAAAHRRRLSGRLQVERLAAPGHNRRAWVWLAACWPWRLPEDGGGCSAARAPPRHLHQTLPPLLHRFPPRLRRLAHQLPTPGCKTPPRRCMPKSSCRVTDPLALRPRKARRLQPPRLLRLQCRPHPSPPRHLLLRRLHHKQCPPRRRPPRQVLLHPRPHRLPRARAWSLHRQLR